MNTSDLIIPLRVDAGNAPATLAALGTPTKQVSRESVAGARQTANEIHELTESMLSTVRSLGTLGTAKEVFGAVRDCAKVCSHYVGRISRDFIDFRRTMQQLVILSQHHNYNQCTVEQARSATASSVTPQERIKLQAYCHSYAGGYIEKKQPGLNSEQMQEYQKSDKCIKIPSIDVDLDAQVGGRLLQFSEDNQIVPDVLDLSGDVSKTIKSVPVSVSPLMPETLRIAPLSAQTKQEAQLLGVMSHAVPGHKESEITNTLNALTTGRPEVNSADFDLTNGMPRLREVEATSGMLHAKKVTGENFKLSLEAVASNVREPHGFLGSQNRGAQRLRVMQTEGYASQMSANSIDEATMLCEASSSGKRSRRDAEKTLAMASATSTVTAIESLRQQARAALIANARSERFEAEDFGRSLIAKTALLSIGDRFTGDRALENAGDRHGLHRSRLFSKDEPGKRISESHPEASDQFVHDALRKLVELEEKRARQRISPPISAPPPAATNSGRMGNIY